MSADSEYVERETVRRLVAKINRLENEIEELRTRQTELQLSLEDQEGDEQ